MVHCAHQKKTDAAERLALIAGLLAVLVAVLYCCIRFSGAAPAVTASPSPVPAFDEARAMDVWFLDVGQGDSILVRSPSGKILLVDAGPAEAADTVLQKLQELNAETIDFLICTHAHADHIGGMPKVIDACSVKAAYFPRDAAEADYPAVFEALEKQGVQGETLTAAMDARIPFDTDIELRVLSPFDTIYEDENEKSVVLRIGYLNTSVLLTGDAGALSERLMLKALPNQLFDSDVLKLGHHGSYSSTTEKFLKAVSPGIAIASCGKDNEYGHPDEAVVSLLQKEGIPLLTTADYGTIHVRLDGTQIRVVE